jgi:hypothetical protein
LWFEKGIPLKELREEWTYDDVMRAVAILDMYSAIDTARDAYDKAEMEAKERELKAKEGRR